MRNAILELLLLIVAVVLWSLLVGPTVSAHGMNWLNVLVYVSITAESTRLCITGCALFARKQISQPRIEADANRNAAQDRTALRKVS